VVEDLVLNLDLPATIVDAAGLSVPENYQGQSLQPLLSNTDGWSRDAVFIEYFYDAPFVAYPSMQCVRTATEKFIHYLKDSDTDEYYDLANDSDERHNRVDDPEYKTQVEQMRQRLEAEKRHINYEVPDLTVEYESYQKL